MKRYDFRSHLGKTRSEDANSAAQLVENLKAFGISKVGICSLSGNGIHAQNDLVYEAMCEFPEVVEGYADIDPKAPDVIDEVRRTLGECHMNDVKFMPWKHGHAIENCPSLDGVSDAIGEYGVHVQIHEEASLLCTSFVWIEHAKERPHMKFVLTHIYDREFGHACTEAIKNPDSFWVEISVNMEADILQETVNVLGSKRILFGTDWLYKPANIGIQKLYHLGFDKDELEDVLWRNAQFLWER